MKKLLGLLIIGSLLIGCGKDGTNGVNGVDGVNGTNGVDGKDGEYCYGYSYTRKDYYFIHDDHYILVETKNYPVTNDNYCYGYSYTREAYYFIHDDHYILVEIKNYPVTNDNYLTGIYTFVDGFSIGYNNL